MKAWLTFARTICGYIVGVGLIVFCAWHGLAELWRWYSTGELLASFGSKGGPTVRRLITYESDPLNFVGLFGAYILVAAFGLAGCAMVCVKIRRWWHNKPETNE